MATSGEGSNNEWSWQQVKAFERALVYFPEGVEARWEKIATVIPGGKSPQQVIDHYHFLLNDIAALEAGISVLPKGPITGYSSNDVAAAVEEGAPSVPKEPTAEEAETQKGKKRKGEAWTEEEHRQFLLGLERVGKGEWKVIATEFVKTRNATQVASHAQKYFKRLEDSKQNVKRRSIFDVGTLDATKCTCCGLTTQYHAPLTTNEEAPPVVTQETPAVMKKTTLIIQEAEDGSVIVAPRVETPSISPLERLCRESNANDADNADKADDADDGDSMLDDFFSQLSPL